MFPPSPPLFAYAHKSNTCFSHQAGYLITLGQELANDDAASHIRTAAGLAMKNAFTFRDFARLREVQAKWIQQVNQQIKSQVKELALQTLTSKDLRAGQSSAQFIVSIAAIELPRNEWPELMNTLVQNVASGTEQLKQASLITIGFICESQDNDLRESLAAHSNAILTAVVQGARREEANLDVRNAAMKALSDSVDFVRSNMDNEGERNYIMQVVCEATQAEDLRIQSGAFGCLNRIMGSYYEKMRFYMEKALFGLSIMGMKSEEEDVAKLAIEFWCTVCEEEIEIEDDNTAVCPLRPCIPCILAYLSTGAIGGHHRSPPILRVRPRRMQRGRSRSPPGDGPTGRGRR